jgi:hypothetical protein
VPASQAEAGVGVQQYEPPAAGAARKDLRTGHREQQRARSVGSSGVEQLDDRFGFCREEVVSRVALRVGVAQSPFPPIWRVVVRTFC